MLTLASTATRRCARSARCGCSGDAHDAARRAPDQGRRPAGRVPARRADGRAPAAAARCASCRCRRTTRAGTRRCAPLARDARGTRPGCRSSLAGPDAESLLAEGARRPLLRRARARPRAARRDGRRDARVGHGGPAARASRASRTSSPPTAHACCARLDAARRARVVLAAPNRTAALALGDRTVLLVDAPPPTLRRAQPGVGATSPARPTTATSPRSSGSRSGRSPRPPRSRGWPRPPRGARRPTPDDLDLGARQASSSRLGELAARLEPGYRWDDLVLPERQLELLQSISAYLRHRDRVLSDWGYERAVARTQGLKVLFAGESGTGKTMAAQVLAARARARALPRRPRDDRVQVHRGDREEPRPDLRRRRGLERDPVLRRGRRAVRQALGGLGRARPLREHRGRLPAAEDGGRTRARSSSRRTSAATSTTRSCAGSTS